MATSDERLNTLEQQFAVTMTKVDSALAELKEQREDMRRLWERQDAMQAKHEAEMKEMNQRFYDKFDAMDAKIDANAKEFTKQLHSNFVQTMIGVGAIMAAIGGLIITALK
ncbi:MAG: hypothetical protein IKI08_02860 [Selenomonadaceae bacterium]|nr:hypothetical protein [Selenomonadaceae bacterium]